MNRLPDANSYDGTQTRLRHNGSVPRVLFIAIGSRGDTVPMVALARELADRGTETLVLAHPEYTHIARSHEISCVSLGAGLAENANQRRVERWIHNPLLASVAMRAWQRRIADTLAPVLIEQIRADDVVVTGVVGVAVALALAEQRGCQTVHVTFSATLPTAGPMVMMSARTACARRLNWWWTRHGVWTGMISLGRPLERAVRRRLRLRWRSPSAVAARALALPVLLAASSTFLPRQRDWPRSTVVTGAWEWSAPPRSPDPSLTAWLEQHPGPVYIGFGSMLSPDPAADLRLIDGAARAAGVTVVYQPDDSAPILESSETVRVVRKVDHRWLFPRCAAVIHHGGAGTTNSALAAGIPSAIVAHGFDQPFHGRRLHQLGVGPKPLTRPALTVNSLGQLLWDIVRGPNHDGYVESAARVGELVRSDDGVGVAADWIQRQQGLVVRTS